MSLAQQDHQPHKLQGLPHSEKITQKKARINSRCPVIYSSSYLKPINFGVSGIKRKYYKNLCIDPYQRRNLRGKRKFIELFRRSKRLRSVRSDSFFHQDNGLIIACFRSLKCVKSLSLSFASYEQDTPLLRTAKRVAILRRLRCQALFFKIQVDNKDYDEHSPTLVQALVDCVRRLRTLKALNITMNHTGFMRKK